MAGHNLIKKIKKTGSTECRKRSGRPVTATTEENVSIFEELVCSQEDESGTHNSIKQIAPRISISKSSVHRLVKKKNLHCYKRLKTPQLNSACPKRSPPNPQSNETVSPPFGSRWRKRRRLNQNCFWIDINEQIYLLNILWLFSFYEIIVSQFPCNQMKLDRKRNFEITFWSQNFHFSRL